MSSPPAPRSRRPAPAEPHAPALHPEAPPGVGRRIAIGVFAVAVGLLLRRAVGGQDDSDWPGAVRAFFDGFPLLLVLGGALLLIVVFVESARSARAYAAAQREAAGRAARDAD